MTTPRQRLQGLASGPQKRHSGSLHCGWAAGGSGGVWGSGRGAGEQWSRC